MIDPRIGLAGTPNCAATAPLCAPRPSRFAAAGSWFAGGREGTNALLQSDGTEAEPGGKECDGLPYWLF